MFDNASLLATPLLELRDVTFAYPAAAGGRTVLEHVSFTVPRGKVTALMGASGGGKTTVLRLIGGQQKANLGSVLFDGNDVGKMDAPALYSSGAAWACCSSLAPCLPISAFLRTWLFPSGNTPTSKRHCLRDIVLMKLNAVGLRGARDLMPSEISGGMAGASPWRARWHSTPR